LALASGRGHYITVKLLGILVFSTPENAPTEISLGFKKKVGKKRS
jgi:hypothetical protein